MTVHPAAVSYMGKTKKTNAPMNEGFNFPKIHMTIHHGNVTYKMHFIIVSTSLLYICSQAHLPQIIYLLPHII